MDNTDVVPTLPDSSFPLAQCTVLEMGEPFKVVATFNSIDACFVSEDIFNKVHDLAETPLEDLNDVFVHKESPSLGCDSVLPNLLDHSHAPPLYSLPSPSPEYYVDVPIENPIIYYDTKDLGYKDNMFDTLGGNVDDYVSLCYIRGNDLSIAPYYVCTGCFPWKIVWAIFFIPSYDFSNTFAKVKRIFVVFGVILVVSSYLLFSELWS